MRILKKVSFVLLAAAVSSVALAAAPKVSDSHATQDAAQATITDASHAQASDLKKSVNGNAQVSDSTSADMSANVADTTAKDSDDANKHTDVK